MNFFKFFKNSEKKEIPPCKFIMLFPGRTGSSYITERLNARPNVVMAGEILDQYYEEFDARKRMSLQIELVKSFYQQKYPAHIISLGFKSKLYPEHWTEDGLARLKDTLKFCGVRKVILSFRKNEIKQVISSLLGRKINNKEWNITHARNKAKKDYIDPKELRVMLFRYQELQKSVLDFSKRLSASKLTIYYEELLEDEEGLFRRIYNFLGIEYRKTHSKLKKHVNNDLSQVVTNLRSLQSEYIGSPFEKMFYE